MNPVDIGWAAGLFDGEGCITINKGKHIALQISNTEYDTMLRWQELFGGNIYEIKKQKKHHKRQWKWYITAKEHVSAIMQAIGPHLSGRRQCKWRQLNRKFS